MNPGDIILMKHPYITDEFIIARFERKTKHFMFVTEYKKTRKEFADRQVKTGIDNFSLVITIPVDRAAELLDSYRAEMKQRIFKAQLDFVNRVQKEFTK